MLFTTPSPDSLLTILPFKAKIYDERTLSYKCVKLDKLNYEKGGNSLDKKKNSSIVEDEMRKLQLQNEEKQLKENPRSEKIRFKNADKIYD